MNQKSFNTFTWILLVGSIALAVTAWASNLDWQLGSLNIYQLFPLFGLLAWMTMWGHYVTGAIRTLKPGLKKPSGYSKTTEQLVLTSLLLHPGLLAFQRFQDGEGLPLESYFSYAGNSLRSAVIVGVIAFTIFLSFEIFNRIKSRPAIKKNWWLISISQSIAMILIFMHGLRLGYDLSGGWFQAVWVGYGLILLPCLFVIHRAELAVKQR